MRQQAVSFRLALLALLALVIISTGPASSGAPAATTHRAYLPVVGKAGADLTITGLEITQAVQTATNSVPLVAERATLVRVYGKVDQQSELGGITVTLAGIRDGKALPGSPLTLGPHSVSPDPQRGDLASSYNFNVPREWLSGAVQFVATIDSAHAWPEVDESNNTASVSMTFNSVPALNIEIVPIRYTYSPTGRTYPAPTADVISDWVMRSYPISAINVSFRTPIDFSGDLRFDYEWDRLLELIKAVKIADGAPDALAYYALIPTLNGADSWIASTSFIAGIGYVGDRTAASLDLGPSREDTTGRIAAHELGHNHGRYHAPCGTPGSPLQPFPYTNASIGSQNYGFDGGRGRVMSPFTPDVAKDLMSYCSPQWLSDFTYRGIYDDARRHGALMALPALDGLLIRMSFDGYDTPTLAPVYQLSGVSIRGLGTSEYTAELLDASGTVLASYPLEIQLAQHEPPISLSNGEIAPGAADAPQVRSIAAVVPAPSQPVARVRITRAGASVAEQALETVGAQAAATAFVERGASGALLHWQPSDRPAVVRYRRPGAAWTTLAVDASGGLLPLDSQLLSGPAEFEVTPAGGRSVIVAGV
jgi:hypothetical protein